MKGIQRVVFDKFKFDLRKKIRYFFRFFAVSFGPAAFIKTKFHQNSKNIMKSLV